MGCHTVYNTVDIFVLASQYLSHSVVLKKRLKIENEEIKKVNILKYLGLIEDQIAESNWEIKKKVIEGRKMIFMLNTI